MDVWQWVVGLSPHELDALRTIATVVGAAFVPVIGLLAGWVIRLLRTIRTDARHAAEQTGHVEHVSGVQRRVGVVEYARDAAEQSRRAVTSGEATRQETVELAKWVKGDGRRRLPTGAAPRVTPRPEESTYE